VRSRFASLLIEKAQKDPSIVLLTGDLGYGVLDSFAEEFPERYFNLGISEQSMMSIAGGLASQGYFPFVYSIANFPTFRCLEQIRNDISYMGNKVCIVAVGSGFAYGQLGYSHHAIEDISIMRSIPNLRIYNPADLHEMEASLSEILDSKEASYLRLGKGGEPILNSQKPNNLSNPINLASGAHGALVYSGTIGSEVIDAQKILRNLGVEVSVYSIPRISPLVDIKSLLEFSISGVVLTIEEHSVYGGFGSAFLEWSTNFPMKPHIKIHGVTGTQRSQIGSQKYLRVTHKLDAQGIADAFISILSA
jgi:transketolase